MGRFWMGLVIGVMAAITLYLVACMFVSIREGEHRSRDRGTWSNYGLGLVLCLLFFVTWAGQGIAQWQQFTDDQKTHRESVEVGDFVSSFSQSTLENWQSEFLQLFSFVVLSALLIHRGSAESKDSDDRVEERLRRIEEKLSAR